MAYIYRRETIFSGGYLVKIVKEVKGVKMVCFII